MGARRCPTRGDANRPTQRQGDGQMAVLERSELEASPLADLHAIADQLGLDGFRRLRKADLVDAILGEPGGSRPAPAEQEDGADGEDDADTAEASEGSDSGSRGRRRRSPRSRRTGGKDELDEAADEDEETASASAEASRGRRSRARGGRGTAG